jgi:Derlin-2/3
MPPRPVATVGDGDSLQDWFKQMPIVTKTFLVTTLLSGAALSFGLVSGYSLVLDWDMLRYKFHFWRLFTTFIFAGGFSFNFAIHTYVLYENCKRYEAFPFNTGAGGTSADFVWMLLVTMSILLVVAYYFDMLILSEPMLYVIMYNWSRREPDQPVGMFGFKFKALYLPWVYVFIRMIMGGKITEPLVGIAVGHFYYFLIEVLPVTHGYNLVRTPKFCIDFVNYVTGITPPRPAGQPGGGTYTGIGRTLGGAGGGGGGGGPNAPAAAARPAARFATLFTGGAAAEGDAASTGAATGPANTAGLRNRTTGAAGAAAPATGGHNWGTGRTLGDS